MAEFFMGQELIQAELPPNSPRPAETPPEGIIMTDVSDDGWARRYLYTSHMGKVENVLIREIPPDSSRRGLAQKIIGGATAFMQQAVPLRMGQAIAPGPVPPRPPAAAPPPVAAAPLPRRCPGPVEMPDGRIIEPDDPVTLNDICELMPLLLEAYKAVESRAPTRPLTTAPSGMPVPTGGFPSFGPSTGPFGGGGGRAPSGQLGPIAGNLQVNPNQGPAGPAGPPGPPGVGGAIDFVVKTDGDFTAGPGAFIAVPGTSVAFVQGSDGAVLFLIQAVAGCDMAQNFQIGLRVDGGTTFPLSATLIHTFAAGVSIFLVNATSVWPLTLASGPHTAEVMLRGIGAGEFCGGSGLGFPATVSANPDIPLSLIVVHR